MIWILLVVAVLLLLLLIAAFVLFRIAICRDSKAMSQKFDGSPWAAFQSVMEAADAFNTRQKMDDVWIKSADGLSLHARYFPSEIEPKRIVLCAHGYRGGPFLDFGKQIRDLHEQGCDLLLIDERAHGQSEGKYICFGVLEQTDLALWCRWLDSNHHGLPIYLYGISMGCSSVLLSLGHDLPDAVRGVVADCGYTSPTEIIRRTAKTAFHLPAYPLVSFVNFYCRMIAGFTLNGSDTRRVLARDTKIPVLFVHGTGDAFVPMEMTQENYRVCAASKQLLLVDGAQHASSYLTDTGSYLDALSAFFTSCEKADEARAAAVR